VEYFKFWPSADSSFASNVARVLSFGMVLPLIVTGVVIAFAREGPEHPLAPGTTLVLIVAAAYTLVHLLTWTLVRYRLPVDAMTIPFAAVSLVAIGTWLRRPVEPLQGARRVEAR
jgi:uncharacterized membrane protein